MNLENEPRIEGEIREFESEILVDAEPHIMARIRKIFDNSRNHYGGKFTHKPIVFSFTLSSCKDLTWLLDRYHFSVSEPLLAKVKSKATEYDRIRKAVAEASLNSQMSFSTGSLKLGVTPREHQIQFFNMFRSVRRMLLADKMGLGKTISALSTLVEEDARPAVIVVPATLCSQWEREVNRCLPQLSTHVIRGFKTYELPIVDVMITSYNRLAPWQDFILNSTFGFKTAIFDEIQELRHTGTQKRDLSKILASKVEYSLGLSGTPIYNRGDEIWSILDAIHEGSLGDGETFKREWCDFGGKVYEPSTLNNYLKSLGLMLRRTPEDVGLKFGEASKQVVTIDADISKLKEVQDVARILALSVLSGNVREDSDAAREFDWKLRHATGVSKARPVAEFVKLILEQTENVVLVGWHRDVYEIWLKELSQFNPVMFTGSESPKEKEESVNKFQSGESRVFIISLRSGAGLDGLQKVCSTMVFGELDWSPHVMDQVLARLDRDGQTKHVQSYYLTVADGSDPFMVGILGEKRSQHEGVIEGKESQSELLQGSDSSDRIRQMAKSYLEKIGEKVPEVVEESGPLAEALAVIRRLKLSCSNEEEMQRGLHSALSRELTGFNLDREYKLSKRSRLDFLLSKENFRIAIECKVDKTKRPEVYRQVRRYVEEGNVQAVILVAPWFGVPSFKVDGTPVVVVDTTLNSI